MKRRRHRPRLGAPEPLEGVIARAGEDRFAPTRAPLSERIWTLCVGARIAERARPLSLEGGTLTVRAATSVWASELSLLETTILARLRDSGIEVTRLRFPRRPRRAPRPAPPERRATRKVPPPTTLPPTVISELAHVEDDELRGIIGRAAGANLAWQAHAEGASEPSAPGRRPPSNQAALTALTTRRYRNAASRSSPSRRWNRNRSAGPNCGSCERSCSR